MKTEPPSNGDPPSGLPLILKLASDCLKEISSLIKSVRELGENVNSLVAIVLLLLTSLAWGQRPAPVQGLTSEQQVAKQAEVTPNFDIPNTVFGNQPGTITTDPALPNKTKRAEPSASITTGSLGNQNKIGAKKATPEADVASNQEPITETIVHKVSNCLWGLYRVFVPKPKEAKPTA